MRKDIIKKTFLIDTVKSGLNKGIYTLLELLKIILPVYSFVIILKYTPVLNVLANWASPAMKFFGLPGEAVMILLSGYFLNIYAAIGVAAGLELSVREINILAIMLGISHSLIIETAILKKLKVRASLFFLLRIGFSVIMGLILNIVI